MMQGQRYVWLGILAVLLASGCPGPPRRPSEKAPANHEKVSALKPSQVADIQAALGQTLEKRGEQEQAMDAYAEAVAKDPNRADALVRLALLSDRQGKFKESEALYRKALDILPNDANLHCNHGYSLYLQARWAESEYNLRHALALQPNHSRAHNNLGLVLARTGRSSDAFEEFLRAGSNKADAHTNLAYGLLLAGEWEEAQGHFQLALADNPTSAVARKGLQSLLALTQKTGPEAQQVAEGKADVSPVSDHQVIQAAHHSPAALGEPTITSIDSLSENPAGATRRLPSVSR